MRIVLLVAIGLLPLVLAACSIHIDAGPWHEGTPVQGSGKRSTESRKVNAFHGIALGGAGTMDVRVGPAKKVEIEIDDNLLPEIATEVRDGVLQIGSKHLILSDKGLHVTIQTPDLDSLDLSGTCAARIYGIRGSKFQVDISGSGKLGASGDVDSVTLDISGSGRADLSSLQSRAAIAIISGSGSAKIDARESLKTDISGSGSVTYTGNPAHVEKSISGSGSVEPER